MKKGKDSGYSELADAIINAPINLPPKNSVTIRFNSEVEAKRFIDYSHKYLNDFEVLEIHQH
jgi:hypothetical protein